MYPQDCTGDVHHGFCGGGARIEGSMQNVYHPQDSPGDVHHGFCGGGARNVGFDSLKSGRGQIVGQPRKRGP